MRMWTRRSTTTSSSVRGVLGLAILSLLLSFHPVAPKRIRKDNDPSARPFAVINLSLYALEVYWVNLMTESRVLQFELVPGAKDQMNSHVHHEFEIREKADKNGECGGKNGKCRIKYFQMTDNEEQVFTITRDFQLEISNSRTKAQAKAHDVLKKCRSMEIDANGEVGTSPVEKIDKIAECMKETLGDSIYATQEEIDFQADVRRRLGSKLTTYACSDPTFPQTEPIFTKEWDPSKARILVADDRNHEVKVMLQADTTMVALIGNISKSSDCESMHQFAMMNEADRSLVPWEARKDMATISLLSRIFSYVDPAVKLMNLYAGLPEKGQNLFKIFHDSSKFSQHEEQRVLSDDIWPVDSPVYARLLMFCEVPDENGGGAVHFPESGIHIKPALEEALLITYAKPLASQGMNEQFRNEHIFCPILDGNRTFIQHQFRLYPNNKD